MEAVPHAMAAAALSARLGAHREAADEYRLALRFADLHDRRTVADLHDRLSYECYLTDELADAIEERRAALALHDLEGDLESVGAAQRWLSRFSWFFGRGEDAQRYADQAIATLEGSSRARARPWPTATRPSWRCWPATRTSPSAGATGPSSWPEPSATTRSRRTPSTTSAPPSARLRRVPGLTRLRQSLDIALAHDLHEHAARAYTNLGASSVVLRSYAEADATLAAGIAYCTDRDLDSWRTYMVAWLAHSACQQGRFAEASRLAEEVLRRPGSVTGQPDPGAGGRRARSPYDVPIPGPTSCWTRPGTSRRRPVRPSASCPSRWRERRPPGCAATARRWPASWPPLGRSEHQIFTALDRGELSWWLRRRGHRGPRGRRDRRRPSG